MQTNVEANRKNASSPVAETLVVDEVNPDTENKIQEDINTESNREENKFTVRYYHND